MYNVSTEYKSQINNTLRNPSYIKVYLGVVEPDAIDNTISDNGHLWYSDEDHIDDNYALTKNYATLEHNKLVLDGLQVFPMEVGEPVIYNQGYIGDEISDENGEFITDPVITIDFNQSFNFIGLTFKFAFVTMSYPSKMRIIAYDGVTEVYNKLAYPSPLNAQYVLEDLIPATGTCDKIEIVFEQTTPCYRRAILTELLFGVTKDFTEETITEANWDREVDLLSAKIPKNKFKFTTIDIDKEYNPDNADGIWKYIEKRQQTLFQYGYELNSGEIEWIIGGNLFTDGDIVSHSDGKISKVTFGLSSILNQITDNAYKGIYRTSPINLYDMAVSLFADINLPLLTGGVTPYYIDPAIADTTTHMPIPVVPFNEALQIIANASRSVLYVDRDGRINIVRVNNVLEDFKFDFSNIMNPPKLDKIPLLSNVETYYAKVQVDTSNSDIVTQSVAYTVATTIRIIYAEATNLTVVTTGVTVIGTPVISATNCLITVNGTGTIKMNGKKLNRTKTKITHVVNAEGYNCPIENPLIDNYEDALLYAEWVASILTRRNQYTVEDRGYPEIDMMDRILVDTLFSTDLQADIVSSSIKYNGALSSTTKYLISE